jgi:hypothetical protein
MSDIKTIEAAGLLTDATLTQIAAVSSSIEAGFNARQRFRPRYLMETSVLNDMKFPTPDAKYWQCNVERDTHVHNLVMLSYDYREKGADIAILEDEVGHADTDAHAIKLEIQIERDQTLLMYMRKEAAERAREILAWSEIMDELRPALQHGDTDPEAHMPTSYAQRFANELEAMKLAGELRASDTAGAMNVLAVAESVFKHPRLAAHTAHISAER